MIDYFAIFLTHGLIMLVCWRLLAREDLDDPQAARPVEGKRGARGRRARRKGSGGDV